MERIVKGNLFQVEGPRFWCHIAARNRAEGTLVAFVKGDWDGRQGRMWSEPHRRNNLRVAL